MGTAPVELPEGFNPDYMISVQPAGLVFSQPAKITLPNVFELESGDRMELWSFDPLRATAIMEISEDGNSMISDLGGIEGTTWHAVFPPGHNPNNDPDPNSDNNDPRNSCGMNSGSTTSLCDGNLTVTHQTASYLSQGVQRFFNLNYDSETAAPTPIVSRDVPVTVFNPPRQSLWTEINVGGIAGGFRRFIDVSNFDRGETRNIFVGNAFNAVSYTHLTLPTKA